MRNYKKNLYTKFLAALLSVIMILGMMPFSGITAFAATPEHPDSVTISVKDEDGKAIAGASVNITVDSTSKGANFIKKTVITDVNGCVEVLASSEFINNDLLLTAEVSKADYKTDSTTISSRQITSNNQDFSVSLVSTKIKGINVTATTVKYDGQNHSVAAITGILDTDTVKYRLNGGQWETTMPTIKEVGVYSLEVSVDRTGFDTFTTTVESKVELNTINLNVIEYKGSYDKISHPALSITGILETDIVTYSINGAPDQSTIPEVINVGKYQVSIHVQRHGYADFNAIYKNIEVVATTINGLSATSYQGTFDNTDHDAVTVSGTIIGDKIEYQLNNGIWTEVCPQIKNAGNYPVAVKVTRTNYLTTDVQVLPTNAYIAKADQSLAFTDSGLVPGEEKTVTFSKTNSNIYDFSANGTNSSGKEIKYKVINASDDGIAVDSIATIDTLGKVTVKAAGCITVIATRAGNENYNDVEITYNIVINVTSGNLVSFPETNKEFILGQNAGVVSELQGIKANSDDKGNLTYSINKKDIGLSINSASGKIQVESYEKLANAIIDGLGSVTVTVTVDKGEGYKNTSWAQGKRLVYPKDSATYDVKIKFFDTPIDAYNLEGTKGANDWYISPVTVTAKDSTNYTISKTAELTGFGDNVIFNNEGVDPRYIFLRDKTTGGITNHILLDNVKIDTVKPEASKMKIEYSNSIMDKILSTITFGFYNPSVEVKFTAEDVTAGIDSFNWTYTKEAGQSTSNMDTESGKVDVAISGTTATATLTLTATQAKQYRGNIAFTATDKAGNKSDEKTDTGNVIVVDTISPTRQVSHQLVDVKNKEQAVNGNHYYSGDVKFNFTVNEANFYKEDVKVTISKNKGAAYEVTPTWIDNSVDEHVGTYTLSGDGDYVVYMTYTDSSNNVMETYQSELISIDSVKPTIGISFAQEVQKTTITITEHNFRPSDVKVVVDAKDINGNIVAANNLQEYLQKNSSWTSNGDVHTAVVSDYVDGIYKLSLSCKDLALNEEAKESDTFTIDHTKPEMSKMKIEYSQSIMDTILKGITLGFYKPKVTVTFTAFDRSSGINDFHWSYTKEVGQSDKNKAFDGGELIAIQDGKDKSKFTATLVLEATEAEQLRGHIAFTAIDNYKNESDKLTDTGKVIVVDTISPELKVEYSPSNGTLGTDMYYNKDAIINFIVNEANFFQEDVKVKVSKNNGTPYDVSPTWTSNSVDKHVGTYILAAPDDHKGDGDYVITVEYTDRSGNPIKNMYKSQKIVVDTKKPAINVNYTNNNTITRAKDNEKNNREYFDKEQRAIITINEHNFLKEDANLKIIAKDVTGKELKLDNLISKSEWTQNGDDYIIEVTYKGDANYTFDVECLDLAQNPSNDYEEDYFTVDKTAPVKLDASYSTSILDTILEAISFGFYNGKVKVKITAEDEISGVNSFKYSCLKAEGVSSVNTALLNQTISADSINYSGDRKTATVTLQIPKEELSINNQFNGTVDFVATDRAGNKSEKKDKKRIVVDNIAPNANVQFNTPIHEESGISYYDGNINATVTINEGNFFPQDVVISVTKDGAASSVSPSWSNNSVDVHVGTFSLSADGDYVISVSYKDKSNNQMVSYQSKQLTIDTKIDKPVITINGSNETGRAYKDEVVPAISFQDQNFDNYEVTLTRTSFEEKNVNVAEKFIVTNVATDGKGGTGAFNEFEKIPDNDGIYNLTVKITDKAGHSSEETSTFTINRFGSVYEYNDYLVSLISEGGAFVKALGEDLVITEYNADRLLNDSLAIEINRDGKPLPKVKYEVSSQINEEAEIGNSGWFQYQYTINKDNFSEDGVYKMSVSSKDATGNTPENTNFKDKTILFRVDNTVPELTSVVGLEENIINAQEVNVKYNVFDTIGLKAIKVYVDGKQQGEAITDFSDDMNNYSGSLVIKESSSEQKVRFVIEDKAGNITDTDSEDFTSAYPLKKSITVSTNMFVRWYANKPLFWGLMGGTALVPAGISFKARSKKKKMIKEEK